MRAVTVVDGDLRWDEHPDPEPGDTELVVAVRAAGINAADLLQRKGFYPAPPGSPPDIPGMELAGEVVAVGRRVAGFAVGDAVMGLVGGGAQAELAVIDECCALAVPPGLPWAEAGGFPEGFATAYDALFTQCGLSVGDRVLVTGAAGGVGTAGVQLAAAAGASCVASVRHAELRSALVALGAAEAAAPDDALGLGPYDDVLELVGAASVPGVLGAMAVGGRMSVIGVGGGSRVEVDLLTVMQRRLRVSGSTLRARSLVEKAMVTSAVRAHALPLLASATVRVPVAATVPMAQAVDAYERFARGGKLGKIVLVAPEAAER
jgi:NADPH:quinone reductase-like Zn-dependent oxidoreductase